VTQSQVALASRLIVPSKLRWPPDCALMAQHHALISGTTSGCPDKVT